MFRAAEKEGAHSPPLGVPGGKNPEGTRRPRAPVAKPITCGRIARGQKGLKIHSSDDASLAWGDGPGLFYGVIRGVVGGRHLVAELKDQALLHEYAPPVVGCRVT